MPGGASAVQGGLRRPEGVQALSVRVCSLLLAVPGIATGADYERTLVLTRSSVPGYFGTAYSGPGKLVRTHNRWNKQPLNNWKDKGQSKHHA